MVTFEQIQEANKSIKTTEIKGKGYAEVNQRIKAFRMVHPNGSIHTEMKLDNGVCIMRAYITDEDGKQIATGTAYEKEGSTFINKTSYIENAETSAIGRALGIAGFGIDTSVSSKEEVENAIAQQEDDKKSEKQKRENKENEKSKKIDSAMAKSFKDRCNGDIVLEKYILGTLNLKQWEDMTVETAGKLNAGWNDVLKKFEEVIRS